MKIDSKFEKYICYSNCSLQDSLTLLNRNREKCLIILNKKNQLIGSLTDGDVRRAILTGAEFSEKITKFINVKPFFLRHSHNYNNKILNSKILEFKVIPLVDKKKRFVSLISIESLRSKFFNNKYLINFLKTAIIIMAGGEGKRLLPYTMVIPKPLLPLNGKSMIENVINKFQIYGFKSFIISINYKSSFLLSFFKHISKNFKLKFIHEKKPLGTAGSLSMLNSKLAKNLFVINCDTLINCDYLSFYDYHLENNYDMTIVVSKKKYTIPYGSCQITRSGKLKKIVEKPDISYLANTGLYIIKSKILKLIPFEKELNMNELIEIVLKKKFKVGVFPVREQDWSDLGNLSDINNSAN